MANDDKLKEAIITHLTSEISTLTNMKSNWRLRILSLIYVGPFIVLGSVFLAKDNFPGDYSPDRCDIVLMLLLGISWVGMGFLVGRMEDIIQNKCNKWRKLILKITTNEIELKDIEKSGLYFYTYKTPMRWQYVGAYLLQIFILLLCVFLISSIFFK